MSFSVAGFLNTLSAVGTIANTVSSIGNFFNSFNQSSASGQSSMSSQVGGSSSSTTGTESGTSTTTGGTTSVGNIGATSVGTATGSNWTQAAGMNLLNNIMSIGLNAISQSSAQKYSSAEALAQRQWASAERETAYQDTVKDLMAAGLNPALAAYNGATQTGSGSSASMSAQHYSANSLSAMYEYGNNTAEYVEKMMNAAASAKTVGSYDVTKKLESMTSEFVNSSASAQSWANSSGSSNQHSNNTEKSNSKTYNSESKGEISGKASNSLFD